MKKQLLFFIALLLFAATNYCLAQRDNTTSKTVAKKSKQIQPSATFLQLNTSTAAPLVSRCPLVNIVKAADTICGLDNGGTYNVQALLSGPALIEWRSSGDGFFYDNTAASTSYQYTASESGSGFVWLYVTVRDSAHRCRPAKDSIFVRLNDPARINLNDFGYFECGNSPVYLDANISGTANTVYWTSNGTGYFSPNPGAITSYFPSLQDRRNGAVGITGITDNPEGPCAAASDMAVIEFTDGIVDAGPDISVCANSKGGAINADATPYHNSYDIHWTSNGTGTFDDAFSFNTIYRYTAADAVRGNVQLYATTDLNPCGTFTDTVNIWLQPAAGVKFTSRSLTACVRRPVVTAEVELNGSATSGTWSTTGSGYFDNPTALRTVYHGSRGDIAQQCIQLKFTTNDPKGPCGAVTAAIKTCFVEQCTAAKSAATDNTIALYPNPARDFIIVNAAALNKTTARLTDITGKTLACKWIGNNSLDIAALVPGTYLLQIVSGGEKQVLRFVKF